MFLLPEKYLEVKVIPNTKMSTNRGVFAKQDIPGGTVIGDYLGKIISNEDQDEIKYGTYYMNYNEDSTIYADPKNPGIQLINHSCMANCAMIEDRTHTLYYALRKIFKGEELTVMYSLGYPSEDCNPCTHQCYCGTPLCTGTTHSAETEDDPLPEYKPSEYLKPGSELKMLKKYPKIIRDSVEDDLFASLTQKPIELNDATLPPLVHMRKLIRETGKALYFKKLHLTVNGFQKGYMFAKFKKPRSV
jgi:hypothetical protein